MNAEPAALRRLIYVSEAATPVTPKMIEVIVDRAVERNSRDGISGALLCSASHFMQWLEGSSEAVEAVWTRIRHDRRHQITRVLFDGTVSTRRFGDWAMLKCLGLYDHLERDTPIGDIEVAGVAERLFELSRQRSAG